MRTRFIPVLFVLLILLAGCSANKDLPQSTESAVSSDGNISEVQQDEQFTDEPSATETESIASSIETEVVAKPDESRETEAITPSSSASKPTESKAEANPIEIKPAETKPTLMCLLQRTVLPTATLSITAILKVMFVW